MAVRADVAVRDVEPLADLSVRQSRRRELRDLELMGSQLVAGGGAIGCAPLRVRSDLQRLEDASR
jgi:hypothetical protein